jgi:release factor glutamine methyltransferase
MNRMLRWLVGKMVSRPFALVERCAAALAPGGVLFLEHHHDQSESVQDLMRRVGLVNVSAANDLEGVARFAQGQRALTSAL